MRSNNHNLYAAILVFTLAAGKGFAQTNAIGSELAVQLLHQFSWGPTEPRCIIQATDGNFYGLTKGGGTERKGTIFRMTTNGVFSTLVSFGSTNGSYPSGSSGSLVQGRDGNLYGTTAAGGATDLGTVFRATAAGELRTLASFNGANGNGPRILLEAADGNFFGTTDSGGTGDLGTVFRMTPEGILTTVLSFSGTNGTRPNGLIQGSDGTFYGTTTEGGR